MRSSVHGLFLAGLLGAGATTACTTFDGLDMEGEPDAKTNTNRDGGGTGAPAAPGAKCTGPADCASGVCGPDGTCGAPSTTDGTKNGDETDIDCGGGTPTKCAEGKACRDAADCIWGFCTANVCEGHQPGRKDGDQTDIDCGGTMSPACDWGRACLVDNDCTSKVCEDKTCLTGPSCRTVHGGTTCGTGEFGDPGKQHESCCKSLPVVGYSDPREPGKAVYVDKYEITAGRMRAFVDAVAAGNGGVPDIKAYMAAHRTSHWNNGWEAILPQANAAGTATFTIANPTVDPLNPGPDKFATLNIIPEWAMNVGSFTVDTGLFNALGANHYFPEYVPASAATHNLNCTNEAGSYGLSTYWFDQATVATYGGGVGKKFSKDDMDEKALTCAPFALLAAFCAWDGGEIMTTDVFDYIAGGPWPTMPGGDFFGAGGWGPPRPTPPRLTGGTTTCASDTLATVPDTVQACYNVYFYPDDEGNNYDGTSRIAPPGRVPADRVAIGPNDEPWMDLTGNLHEAAVKVDGTFEYRGYGLGWLSIQAHRPQILSPRMKSGSIGSRCMRFK